MLAETGILTDSLDSRGFNQSKLEQVVLELERDDNEDLLACSPGVVPTISIDQEAIFKKLDKRAARDKILE